MNFLFAPTVATEPGDKFLGICPFPKKAEFGIQEFFNDGCQVLTSTMPGGSLTEYCAGGTVVHESGYWMGFLHTFEGMDCKGPGDYIADTPCEAIPTNGCPENKDKCPDQPRNDPIHDFMDYSDDVW